MATSEECESVDALINKPFKCCKSKVSSSAVCVNCGNIYHRSCLKREFPNLVSETGDTRIKCCSIIPNETKMFQLVVENLKSENEMLKKLLTENEEKYQLLLETKVLMEKNNLLLNENNKLMEEKIQNYKNGPDKNKNIITKNTNKEQQLITNEKINLEAQKPTTSKETPKPVTPKQRAQISLKGHKTTTQKHFTKDLENAQKEKMDSLIYINTPLEPKTDIYENNGNNEWKVVQNRGRNKYNKKYIGESEENNENFKGAEPKVWLYLYRVLKEVTEDNIKQFIKKKTNPESDNEIIVRQISSESTQFNRFMVATEFKYKDMLYDPKFWPKGVGYKRFDFKRYYETHRPTSFLE